MGDRDSDPFVDEILRRRGQITIFDLLRRRFGGSDPGEAGAPDRQRQRWPLLTTISVLLGLMVAWPDIAGGAGIGRILIVWMVSAGVSYAILFKLEAVIFWGALGVSVASIFILAAQTLDFIETGLFPVWHVGDVAMAIGLPDSEAGSFLERLYDLIALVAFIGLSVILWALVWGGDRLRRSVLLKHPSGEDSP